MRAKIFSVFIKFTTRNLLQRNKNNKNIEKRRQKHFCDIFSVKKEGRKLLENEKCSQVKLQLVRVVFIFDNRNSQISFLSCRLGQSMRQEEPFSLLMHNNHSLLNNRRIKQRLICDITPYLVLSCICGWCVVLSCHISPIDIFDIWPSSATHFLIEHSESTHVNTIAKHTQTFPVPILFMLPN